MTDYPYWPAGLPQRPLPGMRASPQRSKVSFQPEVGPSIDRRRASSNVQMVQVSFDLTSFEQLAEFEAWVEDDLESGTLPFLWADPRDEYVYLWKFSADESPYEANSERGTYSTISMKLQRIARWND